MGTPEEHAREAMQAQIDALTSGLAALTDTVTKLPELIRDAVKGPADPPPPDHHEHVPADE